MYKLKQLPPDFQVIELSSVKLQDKGSYLYFKVKKTNLDTLTVVQAIAKRLHLKEKHIGFAGNKDKTAVTEQVMSVKGVSRQKLALLNLAKVEITILGYGNKPVTLGSLQKNKFQIVVRNLLPMTSTTFTLLENYFDEQRFSNNNCAIGRALIKKNFSEAVSLIDKKYPNNQNYSVYRSKQPTNHVGALQCLPLRLLRLYVHAYQSFLWNETVKRYLQKKTTSFQLVNYSLGQFLFADQPDQDLPIPLLGFALPEIKDTLLQEIISKLMSEENLTAADFIIKTLPQLSLEGLWRPAYAKVYDLSIGNWEQDELNPGRNKVTISFSLDKGSYATLVIKKLMSL